MLDCISLTSTYWPMCPGSGECGRGSVGDVLVRMRLFRLLVLQLEHIWEQRSGQYLSSLYLRLHRYQKVTVGTHHWVTPWVNEYTVSLFDCEPVCCYLSLSECIAYSRLCMLFYLEYSMSLCAIIWDFIDINPPTGKQQRFLISSRSSPMVTAAMKYNGRGDEAMEAQSDRRRGRKKPGRTGIERIEELRLLNHKGFTCCSCCHQRLYLLTISHTHKHIHTNTYTRLIVLHNRP